MTLMRAWTPLAVLILAAAAAPATAADPAKPARHCFWPSQINGFRPVDDTHVNLDVGVNEVYQVELLAPCPDIRWSEGLGVESRGASTVCTDLDLTIISPSPIGPRRCAARNLRRLSPEEAAATSGKKPR